MKIPKNAKTLHKTSLYNNSKKNVFKKRIFFGRKNLSIKRVIFSLTFLCLIITAITFGVVAISKRLASAPNVEQLKTYWNSQNYQSTYDYSKDILSIQPFNNSALTYYGYSAFYLALASTDSVLIHEYIDESINSLRLALLDATSDVKPQLEYMLGKAYFHKNRLSAYYFYADLAIKYLHSAHNNGYNASDIYEYLGLSYASLDMTRESIVYFTEALLVNNSDVLQMAIAEQYFNIENYDAAKPYLQRVKNESENELYIVQCLHMLGLIHIAEGNYLDAQAEFENMLLLNNQSADAYYGLGLVYESQGDFIKARAQWRRALDLEVNHPGALLKIK